ncbi:MAG: Do family serine endopeptidase [Alphaproteobacteria bacterium]|nr:Do family serine endopeptidase [Alphaproteobacteria bacterium]
MDAVAGEPDPAGAGIPMPERPTSFADLADQLLPSVVNISTTQTVRRGDLPGPDIPQFPPGSPFRDFFDEFFNEREGPEGIPRQATSLGSGFIISEDGYIVTNFHVIQGADEITVLLQDESAYPAEVVGTDDRTDLAVLRVEADEPLPAVPWGDSEAMRVGDWVIAIGNPFGLGGSVTAGIISARARDIRSGPYDDFIQTDASINRGNSGGPMFNLGGQVIGINTAIFSPTGGSVGVGFAIPSSLARGVIDQLIEFGRTRRGWLGVRIQTVTEEIAESLGLEEPRGALVASVTPTGPAEDAGIQPGDVILRFNDRPVEEMRRLPRLVAETAVGSTVEVVVWRRGERRTLEVELGELEQAEEEGLLTAGPGEAPPEEEAEKPQAEVLENLGFTLSAITAELRQQYDLPSQSQGVLITRVLPGTAAEEKGLRPGEVIVEVGQEPVETPADVAARVEDAREAGRNSVLLLINREGDLRFVALRVAGEE